MVDSGSMMTIIGGGAALGLIATCWGHIKGWVEYLSRAVVVSTPVDKNISDNVYRYCAIHYKKIPFNISFYDDCQQFVKKKDRVQRVVFARPWKNNVFYRLKPFEVVIFQDSGDKNESFQHVTTLRWCTDVEKLLAESVSEMEDMRYDVIKEQHDVFNRRFRVYRMFGFMFEEHSTGGGVRGKSSDTAEAPTPIGDKAGDSSFDHDHLYTYLKSGVWRLIGYGNDDIRPTYYKEANDGSHLAFPAVVKDYIREITQWKESRKWYESKRIPWKRGWLLHGIPGTGKTSLARMLAETLDLPIYVFDLTTFTNSTFSKKWSTLLGDAPCIALIEDIDNVFHGRENVNKSSLMDSPLTFDCLLNMLDGVEKNDGIFTIITTNHLDKVDPALAGSTNGVKASRPGRIDRVIELGFLDRDCRMIVARNILGEWPEIVEKVVDDENSQAETPAQFQEKCVRIALEKFWKATEQKEENPKKLELGY